MEISLRVQPHYHQLPNRLASPGGLKGLTVTEAVDKLSLQTIFGRDDVPDVPKISSSHIGRHKFTQKFIRSIAKQKGDQPITYICSPRPPESHEVDLHVAEGLRSEPKYGLVLDPTEMKVEGWSEQDYENHWNEVKKAFADDLTMVLGPGWEQTEKCKKQALAAVDMGVTVKQIGLHDLDEQSIRTRLQESTAELRGRGFQVDDLDKLLDGSVDQGYLQDTATGSFTSDQKLSDTVKYVRDVVHRTLNGRDESNNDGARRAGRIPRQQFTELYVEHALDQLQGRPMTYVSTPITGGHKKYDFLEDQGVSNKKELDSDGKKEFVQDVILANTNKVFRVAESLRFAEPHPVMDPAEITIPEWSQADYAAHWDAVVEKLASKVVLVPGWQYSKGCILELQRAVRKGIPIQEIQVAEVPTCEILGVCQPDQPSFLRQ